MHILIVEKDEAMKFVLFRLCHALNPKCVVASTPHPASAIETLDHQAFDILLVTPDEDESDALVVLKHARRRHQNLIIVLMTNLIGRHQQEAFRHGVDYCFMKGTSDMPRILTDAMSRVDQMSTDRSKK